MARIRTIKPEFWEDEKVARLPIPCRLFFIGCWNFADDFGCIKGSPALLKSQIFPYDEGLRASEVKKWLDALVDARMLIPIIYDPHNSGSGESYYYIRTFRSHQILDKRYDKSYIGKEVVKELIDKALREHNESTQCSPRHHDVITMPEEEKEMESKPLSPNGDIPAPNDKFRKFQKWIEDNAPNVAKMQSPFTEAEFNALKRDFTVKQIEALLIAMHNYKPLLKKSVSANLTLRNWAKRDYGADTGDGRKLAPKDDTEANELIERLKGNG